MVGHQGFFARRWHGEVSPGVLLWRDMIGIGTFLNLLASLAALILLAQGATTAVGVAVHFAPVPYNVFLFLAVRRQPARSAGHLLVASVWLVAMAIF